MHPSDHHTMTEPQELQLIGCIGFSGQVPRGLAVHSDREHILYPLGCNVVVQRIGGKKSQTFLQGHSDFVTCIAVSKSGKYVATGQQSSHSAVADIIVWDFPSRQEYCRFSMHQGKVQSLGFSPTEKYLVSVGGPHDNNVCAWDIASRKALCKGRSGNGRGGNANAIAFSNHSDLTFITGGDESLRVWNLMLEDKVAKIIARDVALRGLRRVVDVVVMSDDDSTAFCGTTSGDILAVGMDHALLKNVGPDRGKFGKGVRDLALLGSGDLVVGAGDGTIAHVSQDSFKTVKRLKVEGGITSVSPRGDGHELFVGTELSNMFRVGLADMSAEKISASHAQSITDIQFPLETAAIYGTAAGSQIRIWNSSTHKELLRIEKPGLTCNTFNILPSGDAIVSGWSDGAIRGHLPESGKELFEVPHADAKEITAIASTHDCSKIVTGGLDGMVRIWKVGSTVQLVSTMKEHTSRITSIIVSSTDQEAITSCQDGTCIVWDLEKNTRSQVIFAKTLFSQITYRPDEAQVLTVGSDRKAAYWEMFDGSLIREVEVTDAGMTNSISMSPDGECFAVGGADKDVKLFGYKEADLRFVGQGHSAPITRLKIDPTQNFIVSVSSDGAILHWMYPN